ncbi:RNase H domain-containing protein [Trichonephila clavipes]|nr:RNase H domain-containing protein [Trichonephila clavipes]
MPRCFPRLGCEPYLVHIFLAGIEEVIPNNCEIRIFAVDIIFWSDISDIKKVEESVNLALANVYSFAVNHKLSFKPSKFTDGFFTTKSIHSFRTKILLNVQLLEIEKHSSLSKIIDSSEGLYGVYFHVDLSIQVNKQNELPCNLKWLALERLNNALKDTVHMHMDGSALGLNWRPIMISKDVAELGQRIRVSNALWIHLPRTAEILDIIGKKTS